MLTRSDCLAASAVSLAFAAAVAAVGALITGEGLWLPLSGVFWGLALCAWAGKVWFEE